MHVFVKELAEWAEQIEQEFFRIERENGWIASLINGLIAGVAVGVVAWIVTRFERGQEGDLLLFACLGSSSAAIVLAPVAKTNSLRSILIAYAVSASVCLLLYPLHHYTATAIPLQCLLAVCLSVFSMRALDAMHPAAVGSALAFIIYDRDINSLLLLMVAIMCLLVIVKVLAYIYRQELTFRDFPLEFRRSYYGSELTLTLVDSDSDNGTSESETSSDSDADSDVPEPGRVETGETAPQADRFPSAN